MTEQREVQIPLRSLELQPDMFTSDLLVPAAGLGSVSQDLSHAAASFGRLLSLPLFGQPGYDGLLERVLWQAGVVSYGRAFGSGRGFLKAGTGRPKLTRFVDELSPEQRSLHDSLLAERDKHIAHSVSADEGVHIIASFGPEEGGAFIRVDVTHRTRHAFARDQVPACINLCERLRTAVDRAARELIQQLAEECTERQAELSPKASFGIHVDTTKGRGH
jgi:hypothetical protein